MPGLFAIKPLSLLTQEAGEEGENTLKRSLSAFWEGKIALYR